MLRFAAVQPCPELETEISLRPKTVHLQIVNQQLANVLDAINNLAQIVEAGEAEQTYITRRNQLLDVSFPGLLT